MDVERTPEFDNWLRRLKDRAARARIIARIDRIINKYRGALGDWKPIGGKVRELRIDYGPGYRLYFVQRGTTLVILLCGGDKGSQAHDVERAKALAEGLE